MNLAEQTGVKVIDANFETNTVTTEQKEELISHYIVVEDGANSNIGKKMIKKIKYFKKDYLKNIRAKTIEVEIPRKMIAKDMNEPILYFGVIKWGYGWVFPESDRLTVGLGGLKTKNKDFREIFENYLDIINLGYLSLDIKEWPIPFRIFLKRPVYQNTFLVDDPANLVDSLTG